MFKSLTARRSVFGAALAIALFAVPAVALSANGTSLRTNLGAAGYCQTVGGYAGPALGKVQISTSTATSPGFHDVNVDVKVGGGNLAAGTYDVYLVNLYRDDTGQVVGCSASALSSPLTVKGGGPAEVRGSTTRYTGSYELEVYVGAIGGSGYASAPATVDVA